MTGASGQIYGVRALELLAEHGYETHLILSKASKVNLNQEIDYTPSEVEALASEVHQNGNIGAKTASGSFKTEGMIVAPCSMKTLSNIAHGNAGDLITRSADVVLKERRPLVVMPREKPFNRIHLKNMLELTDAVNRHLDRVESGEGSESGEGGGIGGGARATPLGALELTPDETRFVRFSDSPGTRLAGLALAAGVGYLLGRRVGRR